MRSSSALKAPVNLFLGHGDSMAACRDPGSFAHDRDRIVAAEERDYPCPAVSGARPDRPQGLR